MAPRPQPVRPAYRTVKAPGGSYHIYPDGRKVFVKAGLGARVGPRSSYQPEPNPLYNRGPVRPSPPRPGAPAPGSPAAPAAPAPAQFAGDSTYFSGLAGRIRQVQAQDQQYAAESASDALAHQESMRRLNQQEPLAQQNANESFNQRGLLFSGHLGKEKGRLATQYATQRADALASYTQRENARAEARRALAAGATVEEAAELAAAADRQLERDSDAAQNQALVPNAAPAAPAAPRPPAAAPRAVRPPAKPKARSIKVGPSMTYRPRRPKKLPPRLGPVKR